MFAEFVKKKLDNFGEFQDSINSDAVLLFHSGISSALNIGLLSVERVISEVYATKTKMQNKEGFIR